MDTMAPLIYCQDLVKIYPLSGVEVHALRGVSLQIQAGEMVAIMGASGSGKSTLLNILGCMDEQTGGRYLLDGVEVSTLPEQERAALRNRKLGFVFQRYNLLARASALENVQLPLYYAGESGPAVRQKALEALQMVGLADFAHHRPNQLSGGQQQRVAIARAVVGNPLVILADEPTGALDTQNSAEVMEIFQQLNRQQGVTVVIVTHEPEVAAYCRRKILMRDGLIVSDE
ncbi:ABC transporter ATP-binding protein [Desulfurispora thermophila]|uniref:ABC transporter ATP-binding protein n=1 Tax=Desulfurispora thermophila TaxID=265470 RepID=UPI000381B626|nr:ABC transporter ATP-binding protein [Desulfurispora thermophila]